MLNYKVQSVKELERELVQTKQFELPKYRIHHDGTLEAVQQDVSTYRVKNPEIREIYKKLKKAYTKFSDSELTQEIKDDLKLNRSGPVEAAEE